MMAAAKDAVSPHYAGRFVGTLLASFAQIVRSPSHSRRAEAGRRAARHMLWLIVGIGAAIIFLMLAVFFPCEAEPYYMGGYVLRMLLKS